MGFPRVLTVIIYLYIGVLSLILDVKLKLFSLKHRNQNRLAFLQSLFSQNLKKSWNQGFFLLTVEPETYLSDTR